MSSKSTSFPKRLSPGAWVSLALTALLGFATIFPAEPIRNAVDFSAVADARLDRSIGYTLLGPVSSMFDAMTLFSKEQIIGFTLWAIGLYVVARVVRRRSAGPLREAIHAVIAFVVLLAVYAAAVVVPRPMAKLVKTRSEVIAVDFHAHTAYSHDGRSGWTARDVQDWHTASGFDVVYITDHRSLEGAREGIRLDSTLVGQESKTTILPGLEAFFHGEHLNLLNAGTRYRGIATPDLVSIEDTALAYASAIRGAEPILIETIPGNLDMVIPHDGPTTAGVRAIELVVGAPRGITQTKRDHDRIVRMADTLNLALVVGTNNHGWGKTAPGWTLLRIPGVWRTYTPEALANVIDEIIRRAGRFGTLPVERTTAGATGIELAFTMPMVVWTVMRTLSGAERVVWLFYLWFPVLAAWLIRRRPS